MVVGAERPFLIKETHPLHTRIAKAVTSCNGHRDWFWTDTTESKGEIQPLCQTYVVNVVLSHSVPSGDRERERITPPCSMYFVLDLTWVALELLINIANTCDQLYLEVYCAATVMIKLPPSGWQVALPNMFVLTLDPRKHSCPWMAMQKCNFRLQKGLCLIWFGLGWLLTLDKKHTFGREFHQRLQGTLIQLWRFSGSWSVSWGLIKVNLNTAVNREENLLLCGINERSFQMKCLVRELVSEWESYLEQFKSIERRFQQKFVLRWKAKLETRRTELREN